MDYDTHIQDRYFQFSVTAVDGGGRQSVSPAEVQVTILNVNDLAPVFSQTEYVFNVTEIHFDSHTPTPLPLYIGTISAQDPDNLNDFLTYSVLPSFDVPFHVDGEGKVFMTELPDFETEMSFQFAVAVSDGLHLSNESASVSITINDLNEHAPLFNGSLEASLPENSVQGEGWLKVTATDKDLGEFGELTYRLVGGDGLFHIDSDGNVVNLRAFDLEAGEELFSLVVEAEDAGGFTAAVTITVTVTDENEYPPEFEQGSYNVSLPENFLGAVLTVKATDRDSGPFYGSVSYKLSGDHEGFEINATMGEIRAVSILDFEEVNEVSLTVSATDGAGYEGSASVRVSVSDVNEFAPVFNGTLYSECTGQSTPIGGVVLIVSATDADRGSTYGRVSEYSILDEGIPFVIGSDGEISVLESLQDYAGSEFKFEIIATDGGGRSSQPVSLSVCILQDNTSPTFPTLLYEVVITEEVLPTEPLVQVEASTGLSDSRNESISYLLLSHDAIFEVDSEGYIWLLQPLDFEQTGELVLLVSAFDGESYSSENASVRVFVYPVNEHAPVFSHSNFTVFLDENVQSDAILEISASDEDDDPPSGIVIDLGRHGTVEDIQFHSGDYSSFQISFDASSETAVISNSRSFDSESGEEQFVFQLTATDGGGLTSPPVEVVVIIIDQNDEAPVFDQSAYTFSVPENYHGYVGEVRASDADVDPELSSITLSLIAGNTSLLLLHQNGSLQLLSPVDFESEDGSSEIEVLVMASDSGGLNDTALVTITITDVNEFVPKFLGLVSEIQIQENTPVGTTILSVEARDGDEGEYGELVSPVVQGLPAYLGFVEDGAGGTLVVTDSIDYENISEPVYNISFESCDAGGLCAYDVVRVEISGMNEYPPVFSPNMYSISLEENTLPPQVPSFPLNAILKLNVSDGDTDAYTTFSIEADTSGSFSVNSEGYLILNSTFDYESLVFSYSVTVAASDGVFSALPPATITLHILNTNDNPPLARTPPIPMSAIVENSVPFLPIYFFLAEDPDNDLSSLTLHFWDNMELSNTTHNDSFHLDPDGSLYLIKPVDYEVEQLIVLSVVAFDGVHTSDPLTSEVRIAGINDNSPEFEERNVSVAILENAGPGSLQLQVLAVDADQPYAFDPYPVNQVQLYELISLVPGDDAPSLFSIRKDLDDYGVITNDIAFDYEETQREYRFGVRAIDAGGLESAEPLEVVIRVLDVNEHTPEFSQVLYEVSLAENSLDLELSVAAVDLDGSEVYSRVSYSILSEHLNTSFRVSESGKLEVLRPYDFEEGVGDISFMVQAVDGGGLSSLASVRVTITDQNDHSPVFEEDSYQLSLPEDTEVSAILLQVRATDGDGSLEYGSIFEYSLANTTEATLPFEVDSESGDIILASELDYEAGPTSFTFTITARDTPGPLALFGETEVIINITNVNDNPPCPLELNSTAFVEENTIPSQPLLHIIATDLDNEHQDTFVYDLIGQYSSEFTISSSGELYLVREQDAEDADIFQLQIQVSDGNLSCPYLSLVTVYVQDMNDNAPTIFPPSLVLQITEHETDLFLANLSAIDLDITEEFSNISHYSILSEDNLLPFSVSPEGQLITLRPLDAETDPPSFHFRAVSFDLGGLESEPINVTVHVTNINDHWPQFSQSYYHFVIADDSSPVGVVSATDDDVGVYGDLTYSLADGGSPFDVHSNGTLYLIGALDFTSEANFTLTLVVTDGGGLDDTTSVMISVLSGDKHPPVIEQSLNSACIEENTPTGIAVLTLHAVDEDDLNATIIFERVGFNSIPFELLQNGAVITSSYQTDYESDPHMYTFAVQAVSENGRRSEPAQVEICILNINDNAPHFEQNTVVLTLDENFSGYVTDLQATDPDDTQDSSLSYELTSGSSRAFRLFGNGSLYVEQPLDFEQQPEHTLHVVANDSKHISEELIVRVSVTNLNDHAPVFTKTLYDIELLEYESPNTILAFLQTTDGDAFLSNGSALSSVPYFGMVVSYEISEPDVPFTVYFDPLRDSGVLTHIRLIDFEVDPCTFNFTITAYDGGGLASKTPAEVRVHILNANDNEIAFKNESYRFQLTENYMGKIGTLSIQDADLISADKCPSQSDMLPNVTFSLFGQNVHGEELFTIDATGVISVPRPLDYESQPQRELEYVVSVQDGYHSAITTLTISLLDEDEHCPVVSESPIALSVSEGAAEGHVIYRLLAQDADGSQDGSFAMFEIANASVSLPFEVSLDGNVIVSSELDYERNQTHFAFYVRVFESGGEEKCPGYLAAIQIEVTNENDEPPTFAHAEYTFLASESLEPQSVVGVVIATDPDEGTSSSYQNLQFLLDPDYVPFIVSTAGEVILMQTLDYEMNQNFSFTVSAFDGVHFSQYPASITVLVGNINEHSPEFVGPYVFHLPENEILSFRVNVIDRDEGSFGKIQRFSVESGNDGGVFQIDERGYISNNVSLDYEDAVNVRTFQLEVCAYDTDERKTCDDFTVSLQDVNDNTPQFVQDVYSVDVLEGTTSSDLVRVSAVDADGTLAFSEVRYSWSPESESFASLHQLSIDEGSGRVVLAEPFDYEIDPLNFELQVRAADNAGLFSTAVISVRVTDLNEFPPEFDQPSYNLSVAEDVQLFVPFYTFQTLDQDGSQLLGSVQSYQVSHTLAPEDFLFQVDSNGSVVCVRRLDYESGQVLFSFQLTATDGGGLHSTPVSVTIHVLDALDSPPTFEPSNFSVSVLENSIASPLVQLVVLSDSLSIFYQITSNDHVDHFQVTSDGLLNLVTEFDYESVQEVYVEIEADDGVLKSPQPALVHVTITPVNDNRPVFAVDRLEASLAENAPPHTLQVVLQAFDSDLDSTETDHGVISEYQLLNDSVPFVISFNEAQGSALLTNTRPLDAEVDPVEYVLVVQALDGLGQTSLVPAVVMVWVLDVDDHSLSFTSESYTGGLPENSVGVVIQVGVADLDRDADLSMLTYDLIGEQSEAFDILQNGSLVNLLPFDFEESTDTFLYIVVMVQGCDDISRCAANISIELEDVNEHAPEFDKEVYSFNVDPNIFPSTGGHVGHVTATDEDGGEIFGQVVAYEVLGDSGPFSLSTTGEITISDPIELTKGAKLVSFEVLARDGGGLAATALVNIPVPNFNLYPPVFKQRFYYLTWEENLFNIRLPGLPVNALLQVSAQDLDQASDIVYLLTTENKQFEMTPSGYLMLKRALDWEEMSEHSLEVRAFDGFFNSTFDAQIRIIVLNQNDNPPVLQQTLYQVNVSEHYRTFSAPHHTDTGHRRGLEPVPAQLHYHGANGSFQSQLPGVHLPPRSA